MQYENKTKITSLLNLVVMVSLVMLVGMLTDFYNRISSNYSLRDPTMGIGTYAYFMAAITFFSILILFVYGVIKNTGGQFIWLPVFYILFCLMSTALSGLYSVQRLPFRFIEMFYWVAVMTLTYYAVLSLKTAKFHVAIVVLALPFLSYRFYVMRGAEVTSADFLLLNPVYCISYFMPVVLMLRSRVLKVSGLLLIFVVIVLSYKRMAIFAYAMSILVYFYCLSKTSSNNGFWRKLTVSLGAVMFIAVLAFSFRYLAEAIGLDWSGRMSNIVESGGSGRLDIWGDVLAALAAQPGYLLLGHGYEALLVTMDMWAHNDYLEILYNFGIIGFVLYLMFLVKIGRIFLEMKKLKYRHIDAFAVSLVWFVFGSMFSILVTRPEWFLGIAMFWGIVVADFENAKSQTNPLEIDTPLYPYNDYDEYITDEPYAQS